MSYEMFTAEVDGSWAVTIKHEGGNLGNGLKLPSETLQVVEVLGVNGNKLEFKFGKKSKVVAFFGSGNGHMLPTKVTYWRLERTARVREVFARGEKSDRKTMRKEEVIEGRKLES